MVRRVNVNIIITARENAETDVSDVSDVSCEGPLLLVIL